MRSCSSVILVISLIFFSSPSQSIRINENGGYEDIVVSIGKEVPPIACQQLIHNIQSLFTSGSVYLNRATEGRVYFHRIIIIIPPMWESKACGRYLTQQNSFTSRSASNFAPIKIGTQHPVFNHSPWTQQSKGCGAQGDFISMGYHSILQFNETQFNDIGNGTNGLDYSKVPTDRAFVHEWAKFRYGVFEEIGFNNDPIYPKSYFEAGERKLTACTNHPVHGNWSSECTSEVFVRKNKNNAGRNGGGGERNNCHLKVGGRSMGENEKITSSILSFPQGKNVHKFCDSSNHNTQAPTKQNFLCTRKSTSEIIYNHEDFKNLRLREQNVPLPPPEFIVKQIIVPRFVLLVEETGNMNLRDVWKFLKLAVRKFIKYDLGAGTELGMIAISTNEVRVLANMTSLQSLSIRRALADKLPNYPNVDSGGNISLRRGIFQAVEVLKRNQQKAAGSVIILISQGTVSSVELETSMELLKAEDVALAAIEYPSLGDGKISLLSEGTNSPHFAIRETGVGPTTHMSTFVQLINALMSIQTFYTEDVVSNWPTMIHQAEYKGDSRSYIESNFSFESTSSQTPAEFFIYTSNPNDPKINSVELLSPNGVKYTTQLSDLHDINVIKIDASINEPGVWRYRIERLADSHQSHFVQVVTKTSSEDLAVRLFSNAIENKSTNLTSTPLILFTEVKRKNSPVIDADVEALIVAGTKKWTLKLLDNGNGDPDITRDDGVYSRYVILPPGVTGTSLEISARIVVNPYRAKFIVVNQDPSLNENETKEPCCGSVLAPSDPKQLKIVPFGERSSNSLLLKITEIPPVGIFPPSRIGDLKLDHIDSYEKYISLSWTAPGEDFDSGIVTSYQMFYSIDSTNEEWKLLQELSSELEAGLKENATVKLPHYGHFLLALGGVDQFGHVGKMSNVLKVHLVQPPKESETTFTSNHVLGITNTTPPSTEELSKLDLLLIIICAVVFMVLVSLLIVFLLYCKRISSTQRKGSKSNGEGKIAAIADPKSPIHWSASELLGEHEKRNSLSGLYNGGEESKHLSHTHSLHLNILQSGGNGHNEYGIPLGSGSSPSRRTSSPDSYDDPESPAPIPISVRNRTPNNDYGIINENSHNYRTHYNNHMPYQAHYQTPMNNSGYPQINSRYSINSTNGSGSNNGSATISQIGHQVLPHSVNINRGVQLGHFIDPEVQGSMTSVNSKKRNITMV